MLCNDGQFKIEKKAENEEKNAAHRQRTANRKNKNMERSSLHFAQQASVSRFSDPREQERRQREQQIYAATRHRALNPPSRLNTGRSSPSQRSRQEQQAVSNANASSDPNVDVDWAGNIIHRRHRKRLDPSHQDTMGAVLTSAQIDDAKPFRRQFHAGGRDLRFSSYGAEAEGMPLNSAAYQLSAGEAHTAANWKTTTQASIMESGSAALDDDGPHRKPKGRRIVKPAFENAAARIAQTRNQARAAALLLTLTCLPACLLPPPALMTSLSLISLASLTFCPVVRASKWLALRLL